MILARLERVPAGFVTTYGDLSPDAPRLSGRVLAKVGDTVAWWRVVHADGSWVKGEEQRARLLAEDVPIHGERVAMEEARIPVEAIE